MATGRVKGVQIVGCPQLAPAVSDIFEHCVGDTVSTFGWIYLRGLTVDQDSLRSAAGKTFDTITLWDSHAEVDWFSETIAASSPWTDVWSAEIGERCQSVDRTESSIKFKKLGRRGGRPEPLSRFFPDY